MTATALQKDVDEATLSEVIRAVESLAGEVEAWPTFKVAFLANVTVDPLLPYLKYMGCQEGLRFDAYLGDYDNAMQEALDEGSGLFAHSPDLIVVCLQLEALAERLVTEFSGMKPAEVRETAEWITGFVDGVLTGLRERSQAPVLVHNFETPVYPSDGVLGCQDPGGQANAVRRLNAELLAVVRKHENAYVVDIDLLQSILGRRDFADPRFWRLSRAPYTREGWKLLAKEYMKFVRSLRGKARKCLVLDCDNTLWGGILGEDGLDGIRIGSSYPGSAFRDFQKAILDLHHRGVLLALCSKNNEDDVNEVFDSHPDMVLRREHLVASRVNWRDKTANIREISGELNVGLDSIVFIDDSEFEINLVRAMLPEVKAILLPKDPALYGDVLRACGLFDSLSTSAEDRSRTGMYRAEKERKAVKARFAGASLEDYLRFLGMEVTIRSADKLSVSRTAQLTQRTNQFNLTTIRYAESDIEQLCAADDAHVRCLRLRDRFGDMGLVGVAILKRAGERSVVDTFLLSCRVIGRRVEDAFLHDCLTLARRMGCKTAVGQYSPTAKNGQVADFYGKRGFDPAERSENMTKWVCPLDRDLQAPPDFFARIDSDIADL